MTTQIDVSGVKSSATGSRTVGFPEPSCPTEPVLILQAAPHLVEPEQDQLTMDSKTDVGGHDFLHELSEVNTFSEFDNMTIDGDVHVKGSLRRNIEFWKSIGTSRFILSVISEGYCLPFDSTPGNVMFRNNRSSLNHCEFVEEAIGELVSSHRVIEVNKSPWVVNPLTVSIQPNGKKRLILDLRYVNKHLNKQKVKYEDWKVALAYFQKGAYMISFDLKSGYHHVDIHPDFQTFLGFSWKFSDQTKYFIFTVLPFGLSTAPYIFTKVLKPIEKYWRFQGINIALFLDDGWISENDETTCVRLADCVRNDLKKAGLFVNDEKSVWQPCQQIQWLGIVWNSFDGIISISDKRISSILLNINNIHACDYTVSARELASFVGKIISTGPVFGNLVRIMTRYCSISIAASQDWDTKFVLDNFCRRELHFWKDNVSLLNTKVISDDPIKKSCYFVYSDASGTGCGAHIDVNGEQVCHKQWDDDESRKSSTWRELSAIEFALKSFQPLLKGTYVKWFSDSQVACKIVEVGSMREDLHFIAIQIFDFCLKHDIHLELQWIPRTHLQKADYISRILDVDDWQITSSCFHSLELLWGVHSVDCFANYYNTKVDRFFSRFWNPGCSGVDFFVQNLHGENCLVVPPVDLISRAVHYLYSCRALATLVVPFWPSSYYWPIISRKFSRFIVGYTVFNGKSSLSHGRNVHSLLGSDRFFGSLLALRLDFS